MKFTYNIVFNTKQGFFIRIALLLERRGFDIESLEISPSAKEGCSEMLLKVNGPSEKAEQVMKQISKLIDVVYVEEVTAYQYAHVS